MPRKTRTPAKPQAEPRLTPARSFRDDKLSDNVPSQYPTEPDAPRRLKSSDLREPDLTDTFRTNSACMACRRLGVGHVFNELQELVENPDETDDLLRLGLYRLPIGDFPILRSLAPDLAPLRRSRRTRTRPRHPPQRTQRSDVTTGKPGWRTMKR